MFGKIKKLHDNITLTNLNSITLLITLILLSITLIVVKNIYLLIFIYILIYELFYHSRNKSIWFMTNISGILLLGFIFISLNLNIIDIKNVLLILVKISFFLSYLLIVIKEIKNKKIKYFKLKHGKYTFKELRKKKIGKFKETYLNEINNYISENKIEEGSDLQGLIKDNLDNLASNKLEEYVYMNYLRFYKNQVNVKFKLDYINLLYLVIHVIILILSLLVR